MAENPPPGMPQEHPTEMLDMIDGLVHNPQTLLHTLQAIDRNGDRRLSGEEMARYAHEKLPELTMNGESLQAMVAPFLRQGAVDEAAWERRLREARSPAEHQAVLAAAQQNLIAAEGVRVAEQMMTLQLQTALTHNQSPDIEEQLTDRIARAGELTPHVQAEVRHLFAQLQQYDPRDIEAPTVQQFLEAAPARNRER